MPEVTEPTFPVISATVPETIAPVPETVWDQWFPGPIVIRANPDATYDLETVWLLGNATKLSGKQTNYILRNITSIPALAEQLTPEWLEANQDVLATMVQFHATLVKIGKQLKGPDGQPIL